MTDLIDPEQRIPTPEAVCQDINKFIDVMRKERIDLKQLGIMGRKQEDILEELLRVYSR